MGKMYSAPVSEAGYGMGWKAAHIMDAARVARAIVATRDFLPPAMRAEFDETGDVSRFYLPAIQIERANAAWCAGYLQALVDFRDGKFSRIEGDENRIARAAHIRAHKRGFTLIQGGMSPGLM